MSVRILGALLALLMATPPLLASVVVHSCRMTGKLHKGCCCCGNKNADNAPGTATVKRMPCCDVSENYELRVPAALLVAGHCFAPQAWMTNQPGITIDAPVHAALLIPSQARAPPPPGPPLYIQYQSFLN
jgi:hypothetical protein